MTFLFLKYSEPIGEKIDNGIRMSDILSTGYM